MPVFQTLSNREAILENRRKYPWLDILNTPDHIILEECLIYGHTGNMDKAKELFERHYKKAAGSKSNPDYIDYLNNLRTTLGI